MAENPFIHKALATLRRLGMAIAINDFGTDYWSPPHPNKLPAEHLKIDGPFLAWFEAMKEGIASDQELKVFLRNKYDKVVEALLAETVDGGVIRSDSFYVPLRGLRKHNP